MPRSHIFSLGGADSSGSLQDQVICVFGSVGEYPNLPTGLKNHCASMLFHIVYCIGGQENGVSNYVGSRRVWCLNTRAFGGLDNYDWRELAPMNVARTQFGACLCKKDGKNGIIVAGGCGEAAAKAEFYSLSRNSWERLPDLNIPRYGHALVNCEGSVYALGGKDENGNVLDNIEVFRGDEWEIMLSTMKVPRYSFTAVNYLGDIYAIGGWNDYSTALTSVEIVFEREEYFMKTGRSKHAACVLNDKIFVIGGHTDKVDEHGRFMYVKTIEQFAGDDWMEVGETNDELIHHAIIGDNLIIPPSLPEEQ